MQRGPDNRSFGFVFAGVFTVLCLWPLHSGGLPRWWALVVAASFLLLALSAPWLLGPLNTAWMALGLALSKVTQPIFLAVLFYGVVTPFGWLLRLMGTKLLRLEREPAASTYWVDRSTAPGSLRNQF